MRPLSTTLYYFFRRNKYFFIGCLAGFILSSIFMPVLEDCHHPPAQFMQSVQQNTGIAWGNLISRLHLRNLSTENLQLFQKLEQWQIQVRHNDYEPAFVNRSDVSDDTIRPDPKPVNLNTFDKNVPLVRDKKLKFYRPRFHYTELNIKSDLLLCVLITEQSLTLSSETKPTNQSKLAAIKRFIVDYMNHTTEIILKNYDLDVHYFYPDVRFENENLIITNNLMVSSNDGHNLDSIQSEKDRSKHAEILRYMLERNKLNEYSFVFLFTDQTLLSMDNLLDFMRPMTSSDFVLSTWSGQHQGVNHFPWHHFGRNDSILNYGLLASASILLQCQLNISCLRVHLTDSPTEHNVYHWHNSFALTSTVLNKNLSEIRTHWKTISQAVTVYPVAHNSQVFHLIHMLIAYHRIPRLSQELLQFESKIEVLLNHTSALGVNTESTIRWPPGVFGYQKARTRYEIIRWTYWNVTHVLMPNDIQVVRTLTDYELEEVNTLQSTCLEWLQNGHLNRLTRNEMAIENIYRKFDAVRGLEYIVDLRQTNVMPEKRVRLQVVKPLNPVELMRDVPYVTENMRLTLVLPVRGYLEVSLAIKFLNHYANVCLKKPNHQTMLIIALIYTRHLNVTESIESIVEFEKNEFDRLKKVSLYVQSKFGANSVKIVFLDLHPPDPSGVAATPSSSRLSSFPSELVYLDLIARSLKASSSEPVLLLHCRTNMFLSMDFLNRVRLNTIAGRQIFLPIPFVEYRLRTSMSNSLFRQTLHHSAANDFSASIAELSRNGKNLYFDVRKENGYFDETNFEFASFYLSDYLRMRQLSERVIPVVRNHQSIVKYQNLYYNCSVDLKHLFGAADGSPAQMRAVEPELRLFHSSILDSCEHFESNLYSFDSCNHRQLYGLGPKQKLASIVLQYMELTRGSNAKTP